MVYIACRGGQRLPPPAISRTAIDRNLKFCMWSMHDKSRLYAKNKLPNFSRWSDFIPKLLRKCQIFWNFCFEQTMFTFLDISQLLVGIFVFSQRILKAEIIPHRNALCYFSSISTRKWLKMQLKLNNDARVCPYTRRVRIFVIRLDITSHKSSCNWSFSVLWTDLESWHHSPPTCIVLFHPIPTGKMSETQSN